METGERRLEEILANHCAPVICGQKTANLVAVERGPAKYLPQVLGNSLSWKEMCSCKKYFHVLIYDEERMTGYLLRDEHRAFLSKYGYDGRDLDEMIRLLAKRFENYQKHGGVFPHEIGLFLEYPLHDIEGFISNGGRNALECGYWKVYGDVEAARRTFRLYDELRDLMKGWLDSGHIIPEWNGSGAMVESCPGFL